jgi:hypothetical protein
MRDPVVSANGVTYDRPSIELWFSGDGRTNPINGASTRAAAATSAVIKSKSSPREM